MACDVFEKHPFGRAFPDNPCDFRPEMAGIVGTAALACGAEGLAGISGEDGVESTAERPCIEGSQIVPDWRWCEVPRALGGDEDASGIGFPFDEGAGMEAWFGQHDAQIKASAACAEGQSMPGT